ncbi:hemolysin-III related-domain-containing protein [Paraphoma chrysanthemicola]|uniref:Hemolysin-III related-domain-containing protein n=1 Tax=Paraphoma chrysanthemicola TaxID=798071 RepID=A0A8K0R1T6_9PLEO|nr:hemolysin-III related-domain-containing protein [Paraphoma chrysanthemicola]
MRAYKEVPPWQRDAYIVRGYRPLSYSYLQSLYSLLYVHNQTVNIYTHLCGFLFFSLTAYQFSTQLISGYHTVSHKDTVVFSAFFAGVGVCLGFSSAFHTFSNHSQATCQQWLVLDFMGIICLIAGSWLPAVYYGFYCQSKISGLLIISSLSVMCLVAILVPRFRTPQWRTIRIAMFLALGFLGFFPMVYVAAKLGISQAHKQTGWGWFLLEAALYISGTAIYARRYPERAWPGVCDIWGSSHQIFHVFVLLGAWSHFIGITKAFAYNHNPATRMC